MKRGQVTIFMLLGVMLVLILGSMFYLNSFNAKSNVKHAASENLETGDQSIVISHFQTCMKDAAEDALFSGIGPQGGYINVLGEAEYGDGGAPQSSFPPVLYDQKNIPIYLDGSGNYVPQLNEIEKKLANYIAVEVEKCFNQGIFKDIGIYIKKPNADYRSVNFDFSRLDTDFRVNFNEEDITIKSSYPIAVMKGNSETNLRNFQVRLPVRIKELHQSASLVIERISAAQPNEYKISDDCGDYDKNGLTNVYLIDTDDESVKIIRLVDFSTYYNNYFESYIYQFAVKNVNLAGGCSG